MDDNLEFATILRQLGLDVRFIGLQIRKETDKCILELDTTHNTQKFCHKLAEILSKFSDYTNDYANNLEQRIKEADKYKECNDAVIILHKIIGKRNDVNCNNCQTKRNSEIYLNGEASPTLSGKELTRKLITKQELEPELSQCSSLHIGNSIKPEQFTQQEPDNVPSNELVDNSNNESYPTSTAESSSTIIYSAPEAKSENDDNSNDIANLLELSHSEEVVISADDNVLKISHSEEIDVTDKQNAVDDAIDDDNLSLDDTFDRETLANSPANVDDVDAIQEEDLLKSPDPDTSQDNDEHEATLPEPKPDTAAVVTLPEDQSDDSDIEFIEFDTTPSHSTQTATPRKDDETNLLVSKDSSIPKDDSASPVSKDLSTTEKNSSKPPADETAASDSDIEFIESVSSSEPSDDLAGLQSAVGKESSTDDQTINESFSDNEDTVVPHAKDTSLAKLKSEKKYSSIDESDDSDVEIISDSSSADQRSSAGNKLAESHSSVGAKDLVSKGQQPSSVPDSDHPQPLGISDKATSPPSTSSPNKDVAVDLVPDQPVTQTGDVESTEDVDFDRETVVNSPTTSDKTLSLETKADQAMGQTGDVEASENVDFDRETLVKSPTTSDKTLGLETKADEVVAQTGDVEANEDVDFDRETVVSSPKPSDKILSLETKADEAVAQTGDVEATEDVDFDRETIVNSPKSDKTFLSLEIKTNSPLSLPCCDDNDQMTTSQGCDSDATVENVSPARNDESDCDQFTPSELNASSRQAVLPSQAGSVGNTDLSQVFSVITDDPMKVSGEAERQEVTGSIEDNRLDDQSKSEVSESKFDGITQKVVEHGNGTEQLEDKHSSINAGTEANLLHQHVPSHKEKSRTSREESCDGTNDNTDFDIATQVSVPQTLMATNEKENTAGTVGKSQETLAKSDLRTSQGELSHEFVNDSEPDADMSGLTQANVVQSGEEQMIKLIEGKEQVAKSNEINATNDEDSEDDADFDAATQQISVGGPQGTKELNADETIVDQNEIGEKNQENKVINTTSKSQEKCSDDTADNETDFDLATQVSERTQGSNVNDKANEVDLASDLETVENQAGNQRQIETNEKADKIVRNWDSDVDYERPTQIVSTRPDISDNVDGASGASQPSVTPATLPEPSDITNAKGSERGDGRGEPVPLEAKNKNDAIEQNDEKLQFFKNLALTQKDFPRKGSGTSKSVQRSNRNEKSRAESSDSDKVLFSSDAGDISASETSDSIQTKSKKKLKEKDRKSLLKLISEYYMKRKSEKKLQPDVDGDSSSSGDESKREPSKSVRKTPRKSRKGERKSTKGERKSKNGGDQASTSAKKADGQKKKRRTSVKKGKEEAKKLLDFADDPRIDESGDSSSKLAKDNMAIVEDSCRDSDNDATQVEIQETRASSALEKAIDDNCDEVPEDKVNNKTASKDDTNVNSQNSEELFGGLNEDKPTSEQADDETATKTSQTTDKSSNLTLSSFLDELNADITEESAATTQKNSQDDAADLEATQKADFRALKWFGEDVGDLLFTEPVVSEKTSEANKNMVSEAAETAAEACSEPESDSTQVENPFRKRAVLPLPSTPSEGDSQQSTDDVDNDSQVVSPFKRTKVKPLPSTQSEGGGQTTDIEESQVVSPYKRKTVQPLLSSQSESDEIVGAREQSPSQSRPAKRLRSSDGDDDDEFDAETQVVSRLTGRAEDASAESSDGPQPKKSRMSADQNKDSDDQASDQADHKEAENSLGATEPSQFQLNDDARDDFLDLLAKSTTEKDIAAATTTSTADDDVDFDASTVDNDVDCDASTIDNDVDFDASTLKNSTDSDDVEEISFQPAPSQFKLDDSGRDNLLNLLTDKEEKESKGDSDANKGESEESKDGSEANKGESEESQGSQFKLNTEDRDDFLELLNGIGDGDDSCSVKSGGNSSENDDDDTGTVRDCDSNSDDENATEEEEEEEEEKKEKKSKSTDGFKLDENDRNELLDLLSEHVRDRETENSGVDGSESSSSSDDEDAVVGEKRKGASDTKVQRSKRRKKKVKAVNREMLLELVKEFEDAVSKGKAVKTSGKSHVVRNKNSEAQVRNKYIEAFNVSIDSSPSLRRSRVATNFDMDLQQNCGSTTSEEDSADSVLLDVLREEEVVLSEDKKRGPGRPKDHSKEAWDAYNLLLQDDDEDMSDTSSDISGLDIDDLEMDFSDQERKKKVEAKNSELRKKFGITKQLFINVEKMDISGFDLSRFENKPGKSKDDDRLCDLSNILQKRKPNNAKTRPLLKLRRDSSSSDSSSCLPPHPKRKLLSKNSDDSGSSGTDSDDNSLAASAKENDSFGNPNSPLQTLSDDDETERMANALWENIKNSSDEDDQSGGWSSNDGGDSSEDEEAAKKKEEKKRKKLDIGDGSSSKRKGKAEGDEKEEGSGEGSSGDGSSSSGSEDDKGSAGDNEKKEHSSKDADLDSSDEEDFVGVRKSRGAWRYDPLLNSCLTSDSDDLGSDQSDSKKRKMRKRKKDKKRMLSGLLSDSDETMVDGNVPKKSVDIFSSDDSDFEIIEKQKTPLKEQPITITDDEDTPSKRAKGRRNIRALVEDDALAESTQRANNEERERIKRLQERDKAKESFTQTQSQSFGSQLSEDDDDPLVLDACDDIQIKVHPRIAQKLKPHQRTGIQFMWDSCYESIKQLKKGWVGSGCILAHCMGLGKTLQALGLIQSLFSHPITKTKHVMVVCPLSTVSNWRNEFNLAYKGIKHFHVKLYTIEDKKAGARRFEIVQKWRKTGGVLVLGYECFGLMINDQKWTKWEGKVACEKKIIIEALVNPGPDLVICDEGHLLRNKQSQRTLALNKVKTKRRIVLTGTPLQNNLLEYYYMVNFVKPSLLGTEKEYKTNFVNPINNGQFEDSTAEDIMYMKKRTHVLHKMLNSTVQRVEDTELKQYLPELIDQTVFVKLSDLQVNLYNAYLDAANSHPTVYTKAGNVSHKHFLADVQMFRYICIHPDVVLTAEKNAKAKIKEQDVIEDNLEDDVQEMKVFAKGGWYKDLLAGKETTKNLELGSKLMVAMAIVEEAAANGDKVLIFAQSYAEMDILETFLAEHLKYKKGREYYRMDGTIMPEVRTHMCDKFNKKGNTTIKVFIMSTKVGGLGLNLTAANRVIIMNVNWNPSYDTQSVFRAFRFGQTKAVYVYRLIALDTMEEKMYQRGVTKLAVAHRVVDKHQITRHYSAADIQEYYSVRPSIERERPVPNVPEDRILAKLLQKHRFVFRWHEHQALLANRPEEDLDEQQKNAAWEEYSKRSSEIPPSHLPPPPHLTASAILGQPGPSGLGLQNKINNYLNKFPANMQNMISQGRQNPSQPSSKHERPTLPWCAPRKSSLVVNPAHAPLDIIQSILNRSGTTIISVPDETEAPPAVSTRRTRPTRLRNQRVVERSLSVQDINEIIRQRSSADQIPTRPQNQGAVGRAVRRANTIRDINAVNRPQTSAAQIPTSPRNQSAVGRAIRRANTIQDINAVNRPQTSAEQIPTSPRNQSAVGRAIRRANTIQDIHAINRPQTSAEQIPTSPRNQSAVGRAIRRANTIQDINAVNRPQTSSEQIPTRPRNQSAVGQAVGRAIRRANTIQDINAVNRSQTSAEQISTRLRNRRVVDRAVGRANTIQDINVVNRPRTSAEQVPTRPRNRRAVERANTIQDINAIIRDQTRSAELIPAFNPVSDRSSRREHDAASGVDELNSIISERLSQLDDFSSQSWDNDGMNSSLARLELPDFDIRED